MSSSSAPSGTVSQGLDALLHRAAYAPIQNTGWIRVTGSDRVRWLNGMVTNNIAALKPGEGNYNFFLNAQGRIQGDCTAWMQEDSILLETAADRIPVLMALLDHFIIMDDVELTPFDLDGLVISGPQALAIVGAIGTANAMAAACSSPAPAEFDPTAPPFLKQTAYGGAVVYLIRSQHTLVPSFEVWSDSATIASITGELGTPGLASETWAGPPQALPADLESLRILSGTPLYGTDIRNSDTAKDLPQETNQTRALHFAKGCYLGQEIVERIRSRGQVHRTFTGFVLTGDAPQPGMPLTDETGKPIGELTSVTAVSSKLIAHSLELSETSSPEVQPETTHIALGYIRRESIDRPGARIQYPGGVVTPSALPFPLPHLE